ncbi:MAG: TolC family protein [Bacteroidales bacterium]|nr:TolC family protein [Bacteroidales bacterium]
MKKLYSIITIVSLALPANAQLTLQQCQEKARQHYPAIAQYDLLEKTRELTLANASHSYLPQILVGAQATWQNAVASLPEALSGMMSAQGMEIPGIRKDQYELSLQIDQPIWDGGQSKAQHELYDAQSTEQIKQLDVDMYSLEERINELYFGILMLDSRIESSENMIALLRGNWEQAKALVRGGVTTRSDADAMEAELLGTEQSLTALSSSRDAYRKVLELFIGEPAVGNLIMPEMPQRRESLRAELQLLDAKINTLNAQEKLLKSSLMPRVSVFAQGWYGYPGLDMFQSMTSGQWTWNAIIGVKMNWNVSALFTHKNNLKQIQTARSLSEVKKDLFTFNTSLQSISLDADMERLHNTAADDQRIIELRRNVRMAAESKYRNGTITATELLKAITDETTAGISAQTHALELLRTAYQSQHNN